MAADKRLSQARLLTHVIEEEYRIRREKARAFRLKCARIPEPWVIETSPFERQPKLNKKKILGLYDSFSFMKNNQNSRGKGLSVSWSGEQSWVKCKWLGLADGDFFKVWMGRIEQVVEFFRYDDAGHGQDGRAVFAHPNITDGLRLGRRGFVGPLGTQGLPREALDPLRRQTDPKENKPHRRAPREMDEGFEGGQGFVFAKINHGRAGGVPTPATGRRALAREGGCGTLHPHNAPALRHQE
jgi:hypothetical protein